MLFCEAFWERGRHSTCQWTAPFWHLLPASTPFRNPQAGHPITQLPLQTSFVVKIRRYTIQRTRRQCAARPRGPRLAPNNAPSNDRFGSSGARVSRSPASRPQGSRSTVRNFVLPRCCPALFEYVDTLLITIPLWHPTYCLTSPLLFVSSIYPLTGIPATRRKMDSSLLTRFGRKKQHEDSEGRSDDAPAVAPLVPQIVLPPYSRTANAPRYSRLPHSNEEILQYTPRYPDAQTSLDGGKFVQKWRHATLTLSDQDEKQLMPCYGRNALIHGELEVMAPGDVVEVSIMVSANLLIHSQ